MISRRKLVTGLAGGLLTATAVPELVLGNSLFVGEGAAAQDMTLEAWAARLNTTFQVRLASGRVVSLKLVGADAVYLQETRLEQFVLIFEGPSGTMLPEGMYPITNAVLGEYVLRLARCEPDGSAYQATFCRIR